MRAALAVLSLFAAAVAAQRITGNQTCVDSCYQISVAVTQCPDLSDTGVISCICPNSTEVTELNSCNSCLSTLTGITDFEKNSITTLAQACASGGSTAGLSSAEAKASSILSSSSSASPSSSAGTSVTSGIVGAAATSASSGIKSGSSSAAAAASSSSKTGAGYKVGAASGMILAAVAGLVTYAM